MRTAYEIVKAHYGANDRRDMEGMLADIGPETEWTEMAGFPCAGTYHGRDAIVKNVFMALGAMFDDYTFTLDRLRDFVSLHFIFTIISSLRDFAVFRDYHLPNQNIFIALNQPPTSYTASYPHN